MRTSSACRRLHAGAPRRRKRRRRRAPAGAGRDRPSVVRSLSRAGYRALLEGGVRVFEWNGSMVHAKTAVADGLWARVGSTNLNIQSWMGNWELDVAIEDTAFGAEMERMFEADLEQSTEVVLQRDADGRRAPRGRVPSAQPPQWMRRRRAARSRPPSRRRGASDWQHGGRRPRRAPATGRRRGTDPGGWRVDPGAPGRGGGVAASSGRLSAGGRRPSGSVSAWSPPRGGRGARGVDQGPERACYTRRLHSLPVSGLWPLGLTRIRRERTRS